VKPAYPRREKWGVNPKVSWIRSVIEEGKEVGIAFENATPFEAPRLMTEAVDWTRESL